MTAFSEVWLLTQGKRRADGEGLGGLCGGWYPMPPSQMPAVLPHFLLCAPSAPCPIS